ncbi:hypothetical protein fugu_011771 [Takifugu bimaculatus]|uniref:Solute carrier family 15 member 5 n=1 Tax=Takifugu bimaculatus TaxID=433685 RepID=A0A4Z2C8F8_9TELE|nr:hypothetical protein fugu_011771 [Takifugu bimaculatus]
MLPVVAFPFEDFYIDTHHITHRLEPREQQMLFYIGLLAAALGIGGIRAVLCPMGAYSLQGYNQHQLMSFFNWFYWLVNLNSTVVFLGIAYIQQSVAKNLGFLIPFTSVLLALLAIHMMRNKLTYKPRKGGSLLTTLGVFLNSLKMCCLHRRHLSGDVASWLDRAKENNGGHYTETHVENVKILAKLFPLYGLQLLYRVCITQAGHWGYLGYATRITSLLKCFFLQIPSGYYIQTMNSNLHLNDLLLPIGIMNVISILPLLLLAPLMELVSTCYLSMEKTPLVPSKVITIGHVCATLSVLVAALSELQRKSCALVEQTLSGKVLLVSSMPCFQLAPQYILLGLAEALVTPAYKRVHSSLKLQMSLYFNTWFFPFWWISESVMLHVKYPALSDPYKFILITILVLMTLIETIRLFLGYSGNLQEKVPELAGFWLLTILQLVIILFQLFYEAFIIQPLERGVHIVLALFILTQVCH